MIWLIVLIIVLLVVGLCIWRLNKAADEVDKELRGDE